MSNATLSLNKFAGYGGDYGREIQFNEAPNNFIIIHKTVNYEGTDRPSTPTLLHIPEGWDTRHSF